MLRCLEGIPTARYNDAPIVLHFFARDGRYVRISVIQRETEDRPGDF